MTTVDIGMPVHRRTSYLEESIESILGQTHTDWLLRISQDGASDEVVEDVVRPYLHDRRIKLTSTGRHIGPARNHSGLIRTGQAPYVAILHDDDRWDTRFLERRVNFLEHHQECGFVFSPEGIIDANGEEIEITPVELPAGVHPSRRIVPMMLKTNIVPFCSVLVRRDAYFAVGYRFDENFARLYDWEMWLRLAVNFPVGYLTTSDSWWRKHGNQSSGVTDGRRQEFERFLDRADVEISRKLPSLRPPPRERKRALASWTITNALDALEQHRRSKGARELAAALMIYPPSVLDLRMPAALVSLVLGRRGARLLQRTRDIVRQRNINVHPVRTLSEKKSK